MTTLVGITALGNPDEKGIVLASDLSRTHTKWSAQGDVAYRQQVRSEGQKIYVSDNKDFAFCMSGVFDQNYIDFLSAMRKCNIKEVLKNGFFPELQQLHLNRWEHRLPHQELTNSLLIASRYDGPKLYTCYPLGRVEERAWTSIGSGSDFAIERIAKQSDLIPHYMRIPGAIDLAVEGLDEAFQDIYTGGIDLVVVTEKDIFEYGRIIKSEIDNSRKKTIEEIRAKFDKVF